VPALEPYIIEPIWQQFEALLPSREEANHPLLEDRGLIGVICEKGKRAPLGAGLRWIVERTNSWHNAHKKLVWCTERRGRVIDSWITFSNVVIIVGRLLREAWSRYRWEGRPHHRP
jgi:hypothetical protein